jgi:hypothetical protein
MDSYGIFGAEPSELNDPFLVGDGAANQFVATRTPYL